MKLTVYGDHAENDSNNQADGNGQYSVSKTHMQIIRK